jgi:hypothetical protein
MRRAALAPALVLAAMSCRRAPEELVAERDASSPVSSVARGAADGAPGAPDASTSIQGGARSEVRDFCADAFGADGEHLRSVCSAEDLSVSQGVARAAGNLCTADLTSALSRGRATFDADAARRCVGMLRAQPMTRASEADTFFAHAPCDRVVVGTQAEGAACRFSVECQDGLACTGYRPGVDGACRKPPGAGEVCTGQAFATILSPTVAALHHPACGRGAWCDATTCRPRTPAGKACTTSDACVEGLSCTRGRCGPPARAGAACDKTEDCAFGLWCDAKGARSGKCAEKRAEGQPCVIPEACKGRCEVPAGPDSGAAAGTCVAVCGSG